jgi:AICAR transformylase/IMP cyclohydrolase PurH
LKQEKSIAKKIIDLKNADLTFRDKLIKNGTLEKGYNEEMEQLHNKNAQVLDEIINQIGYPTIEKVGKEACEAAWLVIQHSIGQPAFMRKCRKLLENVDFENQVNPTNLAYLTDRIASFEGKPQRYGTQFDWDENGELSPNPFDDLIQVNQRRKSVGLNALEEQITIMRRRAKNENQSPPTNFEERKQDFEKWKRKVGWIK